jgi:hypothetical protein
MKKAYHASGQPQRLGFKPGHSFTGGHPSKKSLKLVSPQFLGLDRQVGMTAHFLFYRLAISILFSVLLAAGIYPQGITHTITFTFDYDFSITPACSPKITKACVQQFNFYDISQGITKRVKLGSTLVPTGATGFRPGISGTTDPLLFNSGRHLVAVSAQMPDGTESDLRKCAVIVKIP